MDSPTIFITGATGFIGSHVVNTTLDAGYRVRLSVRKEEQIATLRQLFSSSSALLEFVVIPDMSKNEAFEGKLDDVQYILHLASPMPGKGEDFKSDYLKPAVEGTVTLLNAAKASSTVKRVVVTSSILACIPLGKSDDKSLHIKEDQSQDLEVDSDMGWPEGAAGNGLKYHASKILAHQATKNWMEENKSEFSLVTLHPSFVLGHSLIQTSADDINGINAWFWSSLRAEKPQFPPVFVDVRDVAEAHLRSATVSTTDQATEFLLSGFEVSWDQVNSFIKADYPTVDLKWTSPFAEGPTVDTTRAEKLLGMKWRSMEEIIGSLLSQQLTFARK